MQYFPCICIHLHGGQNHGGRMGGGQVRQLVEEEGEADGRVGMEGLHGVKRRRGQSVQERTPAEIKALSLPLSI